MIRSYERWAGKATQDPRYIYTEGDMVLMRGRRPHKLASQAVGPYRFIRYTSSSRMVAEVEDN